jgi:hypothetical protein
LVDRAKGYLGIKYSYQGHPLETNDGYGFVFLLEEWNPVSDGIDCSGLVDVAADLRRHYGCGPHLLPHLTTSIGGWENLQPGDLIIRGGKNAHVRIFEKWVGVDIVQVVEATPPRVKVETYTIKELQNDPDGAYVPRRLIPDTTKPTIKIKGVEDGKVYNTSVTLKVEAEDDVYTDKSHPEPRRYAYEEDEENKFDEKTYSEDGEYTVNFKAIDWAKNEMKRMKRSLSI